MAVVDAMPESRTVPSLVVIAVKSPTPLEEETLSAVIALDRDIEPIVATV
jgi:hypothetical protein